MVDLEFGEYSTLVSEFGGIAFLYGTPSWREIRLLLELTITVYIASWLSKLLNFKLKGDEI